MNFINFFDVIFRDQNISVRPYCILLLIWLPLKALSQFKDLIAKFVALILSFLYYTRYHFEGR